MQIRGGDEENTAQAGNGNFAPAKDSVFSVLTEQPFFRELLSETQMQLIDKDWANVCLL